MAIPIAESPQSDESGENNEDKEKGENFTRLMGKLAKNVLSGSDETNAPEN